ncbi:MAG: hypothetical protein COB17_01005 [Sulfurimonas sp.]|nr:MAG: hypothetical protein COB17_01005 [Sulfurimonas sp.]
MLPLLGNILLLFLLLTNLSASVKLIAPVQIIEGEEFTFKIVAYGFKIKFPEIDFIDNELVENIDSKSEAYIIDSIKAKKITKIYTFVPKKTFLLPAFTLKIDSKLVKTKTKKINLIKASKTLSSFYDLDMQINKNKAYLGEALDLKIIFTYRDKKLEDYTLIDPKFENFYLKLISQSDYKKTSAEYVEQLTFKLLAKKTGLFKLRAAKAKLKLSKKSNKLRYSANKKFMIYSNFINLEILELPNGISIVGDYDIQTSVDKLKVKQGEPVKMQLYLKGSGNINNLESFNFNIPKATIYHKNDSKNKLHKSFEILSNEDFIIPSLNLKYFNPKKQKIIQIKSPSYKIEVGNIRNKSNKTFELKNNIQKGITVMEKLIYFTIGIIITIISLYLYKKILSLNLFKKKSDLIYELKKIKNQEVFFKKIVPFVGKDYSLDTLIYKLEKENKDFKKIKIGIMKILGVHYR